MDELFDKVKKIIAEKLDVEEARYSAEASLQTGFRGRQP